MSRVCILASDHAEALEDRGVVPDCRYHEHVSHRQADEMIQPVLSLHLRCMVEGDGAYRTVHGTDGRRRITRVAQVLGYASSPSGLTGGYPGGMIVQQATRATPAG